MENQDKLEISIPPGMPDTYRVLLRQKLEETIAHGSDFNTSWVTLLDDLERDGWHCSLHLNWAAEAKRGADFEHTDGSNLGHTIRSLCQLTSLHDIENCP